MFIIPALSEKAPPIAAKAIGVDMRIAATKVLMLKITLRISFITFPDNKPLDSAHGL